jgi:hypothetical protein
MSPADLAWVERARRRAVRLPGVSPVRMRLALFGSRDHARPPRKPAARQPASGWDGTIPKAGRSELPVLAELRLSRRRFVRVGLGLVAQLRVRRSGGRAAVALLLRHRNSHMNGGVAWPVVDPIDRLAIDGLLNGDVGRAVRHGRAMSMLDALRYPDHIPGTALALLAAAFLAPRAIACRMASVPINTTTHVMGISSISGRVDGHLGQVPSVRPRRRRRSGAVAFARKPGLPRWNPRAEASP